MKKIGFKIHTRIAALFCVCAAMALNSCGDQDPVVDEPLPDPRGTVTAGISETMEIVFTGTLNEKFRLGWGAPNNFKFDGSYMVEVDMCALGEMRGLGYIERIPQSGFSPVSGYSGLSPIAIEARHGYVLKITESSGLFSRTYYARFWVVEPTLGANGAVIGAKVKYQSPFEP